MRPRPREPLPTSHRHRPLATGTVNDGQIIVAAAIDTSSNTSPGDLTLIGSGVKVNADITLKGSLSITSTGAGIAVSGGGYAVGVEIQCQCQVFNWFKRQYQSD